MLAFHFCVADRILRDNAAIVFDLDVELRAGQHSIAELQNCGKPIGLESMVGIVARVRLQHHLCLLACYSAAIDKAFGHVTNFGDVEMRRDLVAVWQIKPWVG